MMPRVCLVWVVLALPLAGCGGGSYKTAPVSGRVTLDGRPLAKAQVTFVPVAGTGEKEPLSSSHGITDNDGRYTLAIIDQAGGTTEGAVVGKHKVMIQGGITDPKRARQKNLPPRYNRKTTLECDVPPGGTNSADFNLKSR
jgi:hypothetical protein